MISDVISNKALNQIVTELLIGEKKNYFYCFYCTVVFRSTKRCQAKLYICFTIEIPNK